MTCIHRDHHGCLCDHFSKRYPNPEFEQRVCGPFMKFPVELIIRILTELDYEPLKACMKVSKSLRNVIKGSSVLQYHIQLFSRGFIDGTSSNPHLRTSAAKQRAFSNLQDSWSELLPRWESWLSPTKPVSGQKLTGGIWTTYESDGSEGPFISFTTLPSISRNIEIQERKIRLTSRLVDFAIDPSQDLLFLVEKSTASEAGYHWRLQFRTMSQNTPHPRAPKETIEYLPPDHAEEELIIQITENLIIILVILYNHEWDLEFTSLVIWDWHKGKHLVSYDGGLRVVSSFAHVTPSRFMLAEYFLFPRHLRKHDPHIRLALFDLRAKPDGTYQFVYVESLLFPPMGHLPDWGERKVTEFEIRSDPGPVITHDPPDHPSPFHLDPASRLFVVTLRLTDHSAVNFTSSWDFKFCIPFDTIIKAAPLAPSMSYQFQVPVTRYFTARNVCDAHDTLPPNISKKHVMPESASRILSTEPMGMDWAAWAQGGVSVLPLVEWSYFVFGMRCAGLEAIPGDDTHVELVILDFSPFAVSNHGEDRRVAGFSRTICYAGRLTDGRKIFDIDTDEEEGLSFVETRRVISHTSGVMMDSENILFLRYNAEHEGLQVSLDVGAWNL
ncbi:hypothetical protein SISSUDRAFT_58102 [Sistotremastrum suecicum HHB10207 ss-3]|uniref:F-box domain-containing protein n=1 Tax=Sistotremastrum suecicum HHB10207 ss-3 TaxID=1314776 RepID=A0A166BMY4_9AGAM|nr:hypothetical protein SISSUDRAFT_58102 [Sistotremastrum suecicum HHB10207 ss-3]